MAPSRDNQPRVLVACPTFSGEAYALPEWAKAYHAQTYANRLALQVDNSDGPHTGGNLHYTHCIRGQGIPAIWQTVRFPHLWDTLELSWRHIITRAHEQECEFIFSVEADVIIPPDATEKIVACALEKAVDGKAPAVTQRYHPRGQDGPLYWWDTLGCSLFPVEPLWQELDMVRTMFEIEVFFTLARHGHGRYRAGTEGPDLFEVEHLKDPNEGSGNYIAKPAQEIYKQRVIDGNAKREEVKEEVKEEAKPRRLKGSKAALDKTTDEVAS